MKVKAIYTIGNDTFEFESEATDVKDQMLELFNMKPRLFCDICSNANPKEFRFFVNKAKDKKGKEWTYVKTICTSCKAQSVLGTFLDNKGYFWKKYQAYQARTAPAQEEK